MIYSAHILFMLKSEFDCDAFIQSLRNAKSQFMIPCQNISSANYQNFALFILANLIDNPSPEFLNSLILNTQDHFQYFTNILKLLIKTHFLQLNCQDNIITVVNMFYNIMDDKKIAEPAIVNLLRYSSCYPILEKLETKDIFTMYFKGIADLQECTPATFGRDYVFKKTAEHLISSNVDDKYIQNTSCLHYPSPKHFLITKITSNLELNIIFYIEKINDNHQFYDSLLFNCFITSIDIAKDVLRYLVGVYYTQNTDRLINLVSKILEYYNNETLLVAIFYDVIFYQQNEEQNHFLLIYMNKMIQNANISNFLRKCLKNKEINKNSTCWLSKFGSKAEDIASTFDIDFVDISHIQRTIEMLHFDSYYKLIEYMKSTKVPFISNALYDKVIETSYTWDGYMQIFLWKILAFQKMIFGFDVPITEFKTAEAIEGYEIISSIR